MSRRAGSASVRPAWQTRLAARYPLLRVMPGWLMLAVLVLPALGFWLGLQLRGAAPVAVTSEVRDSLAQSAPARKMLAQRRLRFVDAADKSVRVFDADSGIEVYRVIGEAGFVRGILRGMARERRRLGKSADEPFELSFDAGMLTLRDLATDQRIELTAFGHTNASAFAPMLRDVRPPTIQAEVAQ